MKYVVFAIVWITGCGIVEWLFPPMPISYSMLIGYVVGAIGNLVGDIVEDN